MGIEKNGQLYWTFEEIENKFGLTHEQAKLFVSVHKQHMKAMGTENQRKYALANISKVIWDPKDKCIKVYYPDVWWHYDNRGGWW